VYPGDGEALPDGSSIDQVIRALLSSEHSDSLPWGIGINCTKIAKLAQLVMAYENSVRALESAGHIQSWPSLLLYPDGTNGEIYDTTTKTWRASTGLKSATEAVSIEPRSIID
jgi:homocysteine S-methyltransferase